MRLIREFEIPLQWSVVLAADMDEDAMCPDYKGSDYTVEFALGLATRGADFAPRKRK